MFLNVKNSRNKTAEISEKTPTSFKDFAPIDVRHLPNLKKCRFLAKFWHKTAQKRLKTTQKHLKTVQWGSFELPGSPCVTCYQLVSVVRGPEKVIKNNATMVARYKIFPKIKIFIRNFLKIGFDLGIHLQVLSKSWLRLARLVRPVFRLTQSCEPNKDLDLDFTVIDLEFDPRSLTFILSSQQKNEKDLISVVLSIGRSSDHLKYFPVWYLSLFLFFGFYFYFNVKRFS